MKAIPVNIEVLEAALRLLGPDFTYPGLMLSGSPESAKLFHDDVMLVAETIARLAEGATA